MSRSTILAPGRIYLTGPTILENRRQLRDETTYVYDAIVPCVDPAPEVLGSFRRQIKLGETPEPDGIYNISAKVSNSCVS